MSEAFRQAAEALRATLPAASWLTYALVPRPDGRLDKPPCGGATTNNPSTWCTLDDALQMLTQSNQAAGIGFIVASGVITHDHDNCRDPETGELADEVQAELERMNSYAYVTPSGKGIRIVGTND